MEAGVGSLLAGHREIHLPTVIFKDVNRPTSLCGGYGLSIPPQSLLPCDNTFVPPAWPQDSSEIATSSFYIANQFSISIVMSQKKHVLKRLSLLNMPREEGQKTILFIQYLVTQPWRESPLIFGNPLTKEGTRPSFSHSIKDLGGGGGVLQSSSVVTDGLKIIFLEECHFKLQAVLLNTQRVLKPRLCGLISSVHFSFERASHSESRIRNTRGVCWMVALHLNCLHGQSFWFPGWTSFTFQKFFSPYN